MLGLARRHQSDMAAKLGENRVEFLKGYIQDLALDVAAEERYIEAHPDGSEEELRQWRAQQRAEQPLVANDSIDLVVSN
jgi:hypothetical protein